MKVITPESHVGVHLILKSVQLKIYNVCEVRQNTSEKMWERQRPERL